MTAPGLSGEQRAAVEAPLGDLCVVAGAGSGKTRVLTARFLEHVLAHGLPARGVAALTFTEKAAREMRTRILSAGAGSTFAAGAGAGLAAGAGTGDADFGAAPISTLHGFCVRLLRRNAVAAGLDPAFRVLDETATLLLREEARERAIDRLLAGAGKAAALDALARLPGSDPLRTASDLLEQVRGAGGEPAALRWRGGGLDEAGLRAEAEALCLAFESALAALPQVPAAAALAAVRAALAGDAPLADALALLAAPKIGGKGSQPATRARKALREAVEALASARLDDVGATVVLPALLQVLGEIDCAETALKDERAALDFVDLERRTLALLDDLAGRGARPDGLPRALLVDEHQDTNPLQEAILARLRALGVPQFSVGDPQQSIYGFRRADVGVLVAERERVGEAGRRSLRESYRAAPDLVAALNGLHERLFDAGRAGVPFQALVARGPYATAQAGADPAVEWALLDRGALPAEEGRRREADYVAEWLERLVTGTARRRKEGDERPFTYGDCAVLVRARASMAPIVDALSARGIRCRVHKGRGFLDADEIRALRHALRVVHNPEDVHALACLVRGPALGASDADLLRWFGPDASPWTRLRADPDPAAARLSGTLAGLRRTALTASLPEVVAATVDRLGLLEVVLRLHDGPRRAANLRRAVLLAEDVARAGHHDLPRFLRYLEDLEELEAPQGEAPTLDAAGQEVSLVTVHGAKGLEWPVVVLPDFGRAHHPESDVAFLEGVDRIALRLRDPTEGELATPAGFEALRERAERASEQERLRLLYVATTRAEERLLLTCSHAGATEKGLPGRALGWAREVFAALELTLDPGTRDVVAGAGRVRVHVEPVPAAAPPRGPAAEGALAGPVDAAHLERLLARADVAVAPLGGTRFVVGVSELMAFARSPAGLYGSRLAPDGLADAAGSRLAPDVPEEDGSAPAADPEGVALHRDARAPWDEPPVDVGEAARGHGTRQDAAGLGRAVHALLERWAPGKATDDPRAVADALSEELDEALTEPSAGARDLAREMLARFTRSPIAARLAEALAAGEDVRREPAFHARIRFPAGVRVATFEALLIKGTIDLWLPEADSSAGGGVRLVDFKTNAPSRAFPTPASLAEHYAWQMRLYALAAERLLGRDVAGASLLLLHPAWGPEAVEVPVDVSGAALEEARRLCQAFALAELEDRWPADWRDLVAERAATG